jgi:hypothetical protein
MSGFSYRQHFFYSELAPVAPLESSLGPILFSVFVSLVGSLASNYEVRTGSTPTTHFCLSSSRHRYFAALLRLPASMAAVLAAGCRLDDVAARRRQQFGGLWV